MHGRRIISTAAVLTAIAAAASFMTPAAAQESPPTTGVTVAGEVTTTTIAPEPATTSTTVAPVAAAPEAPDEAPESAAAPEAGRTISGTIKGIDGQFVNAQISLVLRNSAGTFIGMNGQPSNPGAYADIISMNPNAPLEGEDTGDDTWAFTGIPAQAYDFTFEVYPRGPGFPQGNWSYYGGVSKRRVVIGSGLSNVRLRLPLNCDEPNGTTGSIKVDYPGTVDDFLALSEVNPPSGIQGFRAQGTNRPGPNATFDGIAPDQRYSLNVYLGSGHSQRSFFEVPVRTCQTTTVYASLGASRKPPRWGSVAVSQRGSYFPIPGEFSGDRRDDIFWYNPSGVGDNLAVSSGATGHFDTEVMTVGSGFRPVPGDWNGDGIDDIFWYRPGSGADRIWRGGAGGDFTSLPASAGGTTSTWPISGDFDGNGYSDILWADGGHLSTLRRYNADGYTNGSATAPANSAVRSGDVNGDFKDDLVWYNATTGQVQVWFGRADGTFTKINEQVGARQNYRPILADISGDFRADLLWYGPGTTRDTIWRGRANTSPYFAKESVDLGVTGNYQPIALDLNGEGTEDIFWYAPGASADTAWRMNLSGWIPQN